MTELEIIEGLNAGNQRSFESLYNEYYRPILFFAQGYVKDVQAAHDLTVDAFTKLWDRHSDFNSVEKVKAFLYITIRNACINYIKQLKRRKAVHDEMLYLAKKETDDLTGRLYRTELMHVIKQEAKSLKGKARRIIELRYFEEMPYPEIAQILNTSVDNVRVQHSSAIQTLRLILKRKNLLLITAIISTLLFI